ncbi:MAG: ABC transporter permease DevC [Puniceicoccales bacterium]|jgi:putative ABC transport system permease protein|nr:ABC transporter permease DevC [Puniceicoccales bacterium]
MKKKSGADTGSRRPWVEHIVPLGIPLAWLQLTAERKRFAAAVAGITFAVAMMLFQMGLHSALFQQVLTPFLKLRADVYMFSSQYEYIGIPRTFATATLWRARALPEVEAALPLWMSPLPLKNPRTGKSRDLFVMAFEPHQRVFADGEIDAQRASLSPGDTALMDALAHPDFGPFAEELREHGRVHTELNDAGIDVVGLCRIGTTFVADGNLITSRDAFLRAFAGASPEQAMAGVIQLKPGSDAARVVGQLRAMLPEDVRVFTAEETLAREKAYWSDRTPIGFVITASLLVAMIVGAVIVYQILYTDVSDHLPEYATLKSMGFSDGYFVRLVLQESVILSVAGFVPGVALTLGLYHLTRTMAGIPVEIAAGNLAAVFALALAMCMVAGALATRKLRHANPADIV